MWEVPKDTAVTEGIMDMDTGTDTMDTLMIIDTQIDTTTMITPKNTMIITEVEILNPLKRILTNK